MYPDFNFRRSLGTSKYFEVIGKFSDEFAVYLICYVSHTFKLMRVNNLAQTPKREIWPCSEPAKATLSHRTRTKAHHLEKSLSNLVSQQISYSYMFQ